MGEILNEGMGNRGQWGMALRYGAFEGDRVPNVGRWPAAEIWRGIRDISHYGQAGCAYDLAWQSRLRSFQAFGPLLFGPALGKAGDKLGRIDGPEDLYSLFGDLIPDRLLERTESGVGSRDRSLPGRVTF